LTIDHAKILKVTSLVALYYPVLTSPVWQCYSLLVMMILHQCMCTTNLCS